MIRKLKVDAFGKFQDREFDFKPVTIFSGRNESGKTTLFDALFSALCAPRANKRPGKLLRERYGDDHRAELEFKGRPFKIDEDEFLSLYAIRSGDLELEIGSDASWMNRLKARLFTGGLDPQRLRNRFEILASTRGSLKHNRLIKDLNRKREELQEALADLNRKREEHFAGEQSLQRSQKRSEKLEQEIREREGELSRLEEELARERKIAERGRLEAAAAWIERGEALKGKLEALKGYKADELEELDLRERKVRELKEELGNGELLEARLTSGLEEKRQGLKKLEEEKERQGRFFTLASSCLERIRMFQDRPPLRPVIRWNRALLAASIAVFTVGVGIGFIFQDGLAPLLIPASALALALILLLSARRREQVADGEAEATLIARLKDEWRTRAADPLLSESLPGLLEELYQRRNIAEQAGERLAEARRETNRLDEELLGQQDENRRIRKQKEAAQEELRDWLERKQVAGRDEYHERAITYRNSRQEYEQWEQELKRKLEESELPSLEALKRDCLRRLNELDEQGVPRRGRTELEVRQLELEVEELREALEGSKAERNDLQRGLERKTGEISGAMGDLPDRIVETEASLRRTCRRIEDLELEREAAALARDLFDRISRDSGAALEELGEEINRRFSWITSEGGNPARRVEMLELSVDSARAVDAEGQLRNLIHLSRGTRDAFMLASRLVLAMKSNPDQGLLVLDEPFHSFDPERSYRALGLLREFQKQSGWQIVLFIKDEPLVRKAAELFPEAQVNRL